MYTKFLKFKVSFCTPRYIIRVLNLSTFHVTGSQYMSYTYVWMCTYVHVVLTLHDTLFTETHVHKNYVFVLPYQLESNAVNNVPVRISLW